MKTWISLVLALFVSGCAMDTVTSDQVEAGVQLAASDTKNNNIRRSYVFFYSEADAKAAFFASFDRADSWTTTVRLSPPSQLLVDGRPVSDSDVASKEAAATTGMMAPVFSPSFFFALGANYSLDLGRVGPHSAIKVAWTDQLGQTFNDEMTMRPFSFHSSLSASTSTELQISIDDTDTSAEYVAALSPDDASDSSRELAITQSNSKTLVFSKRDLAELGAGRADLRVLKLSSVNLDLRGGNNGSGLAIYEAKPIKITVSN